MARLYHKSIILEKGGAGILALAPVTLEQIVTAPLAV
jgi:hypothetical protein